MNEVVEIARGKLVKAYRANPRLWPDGIDSAGDRWYREGEWSDAGKRITGKPYDGKPRKPEQAGGQ
jgi:hypothetical protein